MAGNQLQTQSEHTTLKVEKTQSRVVKSSKLSSRKN